MILDDQVIDGYSWLMLMKKENSKYMQCTFCFIINMHLSLHTCICNCAVSSPISALYFTVHVYIDGKLIRAFTCNSSYLY